MSLTIKLLEGNLLHQNNNTGTKKHDLLTKASELLKPVKELLDSNNNPLEDSSRNLLDKETLPFDKENLNDMRDQIYCSGSLLDAVQKSYLFRDCKTFVDMPLKQDAGKTLNFSLELKF